MAKRQSFSELAWAGWQVRIPSDWRPLSISGGWTDGAMVLGSRACSVVQINWQRPPHRQFSADRRLRKWAAKVRAATSEKNPAELGQPAVTAAVRASVPDRKSGAERSFWCCYCGSANLMLEWRTRPTMSGDDEQVLKRQILPSLQCSPEGAAVPWALFNCSFRSPPGFTYEKSLLHSGDIALCFTENRGCRLIMRQVYPGDLALQRRALADWLRTPAFKDGLETSVLNGPEAVELLLHGTSRQGVKRFGKKTWKRLLKFVRRYWFVDAAVHDADANRLHIASLESRKTPNEARLQEALEGMGRQLRDIT